MMTNSKSSSSALEELERQIADYIGTRFAVACSSARTALRLSLLALGIGPGDDVIIPDFACQILPITVFCTGALPRFCEIDRETLAPTPTHLNDRLQPSTKAVISTNLFGLPTNPYPILEIVQKKGIAFIDDAAQALGASMNGRKVGSFGDVGILTFNKLLNVDLGGAAVTNREELANKMKSVRAKLEEKSSFASFGYHLSESLRLRSRTTMKMVFWGDNYVYKISKVTLAKKHFQSIDGWVKAKPHVFELWKSNKLSDTIINQLMTCGGRYWHRRKMEKMEISLIKQELRNLDNYVEERSRIAKIYDECIEDEGLNKMTPSTNSVPSYLRYPILFSDPKKLSKCATHLAQANFKIDYRYRPLHMSPFFERENNSTALSEATYVSNHILPLPTGPRMGPERVEKVVSTINSCLVKCR